MMNDECRVTVCCPYSSFILHPSSFQGAGGDRDMSPDEYTARRAPAAGSKEVEGNGLQKRVEVQETAVSGGADLGSSPHCRNRSSICRVNSSSESELSST